MAPPGFCNRGGSEVRVYRGSRVRSPPVPVVLSVYQRGYLLDGLAMHLSCDTKKFHDNESTHILGPSLHNFWTSTHRGGSFPRFPAAGGGATASSTCLAVAFVGRVGAVVVTVANPPGGNAGAISRAARELGRRVAVSRCCRQTIQALEYNSASDSLSRFLALYQFVQLYVCMYTVTVRTLLYLSEVVF